MRAWFHSIKTERLDWALFLFFAVISLYTILFAGFTTHDDMVNALAARSQDWFYLGYNQSVAIGRFMTLLMWPLTIFPYLFDSHIWLNISRLLGLVLLFVSINFSFGKIFQVKRLGLLVLILLVAILQNGWDHNLLTSYPLVFNFYAACFFLSSGFFAEGLETKNLGKIYTSATLYFISLGTEVFVLFFIFFPMIFFKKYIENKSSFPIYLKENKKYLYPLWVSIASYLAIYALWHHVNLSYYSYDGNKPEWAGFKPFGRVIYYFGVNGFPINSLVDFFHNYKIIYNHQPELIVIGLLKGIFVGVITYRTVQKINLTMISLKEIVVYTSILFVSVFLVNFLLGLTLKYQGWVEAGTHSFTYTYYSTIFASSFVAFLILFFKKISAKFFLAKTILNFFLLFAVPVTAFSVDLNNNFFANEQKLSHRKWELMDNTISSRYFRNIPKDAVIFAPTLFGHQRGIAQALAPYWSEYVKSKIGQDIQFSDEGCIANRPCYYLVFSQHSYEDRQYLLLGKSEVAHPTLFNNFNLYTMGSKGYESLTAGFISKDNAPPIVRIDGMEIDNIGDNFFSTNLMNANLKQKHTNQHYFEGNLFFPADQILLSESKAIRAKTIDFHFGNGFWNRETNNEESWNWSNQSSSLIVYNWKGKHRKIQVTFKANSLRPSNKIRVYDGVHLLGSFKLSNLEWRKFSFIFDANSIVKDLVILADVNGQQPGNSDSRSLSFRIKELEIKEIGGER